jgi:hypothetical protein
MPWAVSSLRVAWAIGCDSGAACFRSGDNPGRFHGVAFACHPRPASVEIVVATGDRSHGRSSGSHRRAPGDCSRKPWERRFDRNNCRDGAVPNASKGAFRADWPAWRRRGPAGNLYVSTGSLERCSKIDASSNVTVYAGQPLPIGPAISFRRRRAGKGGTHSPPGEGLRSMR